MVDLEEKIYKELLKRKEEKRREKQEKMKDIDPYGEEEWE